jgi:hypothetical protein
MLELIAEPMKVAQREPRPSQPPSRQHGNRRPEPGQQGVAATFCQTAARRASVGAMIVASLAAS